MVVTLHRGRDIVNVADDCYRELIHRNQVGEDQELTNPVTPVGPRCRSGARQIAWSSTEPPLNFNRRRDIPVQVGRMLMARDRIMTIVKSEIVLSIIINILARRVSGKTSVGLNAVTVYE